MRGKKEAARQGRVPTGFGKFPGPYGLRYDKGARTFEWLLEGQKQTVLRVLSACLAGRSISSITNELNDAGIRALGGLPVILSYAEGLLVPEDAKEAHRRELALILAAGF